MEGRLGIRENWTQFSPLVLINACVGSMVGLERTVVPLVAAEEFHPTSDTLIFCSSSRSVWAMTADPHARIDWTKVLPRR